MSLVKSEMVPLFVRDDESIDNIKPKFTEQEFKDLMAIHSEVYSIFKQTDDSVSIMYWINIPGHGIAQICRTDDKTFYGDAVELLNEFKKENPDSPVTAWINANARELNIARLYWEAVNLRKTAELSALKANLALCHMQSYVNGDWGLNADDIKMIVTEYGFDPDKSFGY